MGASEFIVPPEILIYAGKRDPSDPDDPAVDICLLFEMVTLALPGITGFLLAFSMIPHGSSVIHEARREAGAYRVDCRWLRPQA